MQLLWAIVHGLQKQSKRMSKDLGLTGPQRMVLRVVGLFPGLSAGQLAAVLHVHPSTLTGVLQRLVRLGLLRRHQQRTDRRVAALSLTREGARLNARRKGTVEAAILKTLEVVPTEERQSTQRVLVQLARALTTRPAV
jgi:DNA-binding MarR family transcriptional regulator